MKKIRMSGISFRLGLLKDNKIEQVEISKKTGINGATVSLEINDEGSKHDRHRKEIYQYYVSVVIGAVSYKDFWCKSIRLQKV